MIHYIEDDLYDLADDLTSDMGAILVREIERYLLLVARFQEQYGL